MRSKQVCPKPVARCLWRYGEVAGHWDQLELRSYRFDGGQRSLYQEGCLGENLHPAALIELFERRGEIFGVGSMMFCGTLPAKSEISFSERFEFEMYDPVLKRQIDHTYKVVPSSH